MPRSAPWNRTTCWNWWNRDHPRGLRFQGVTADHKNVTTLGRGGSDTSAAAFGVAVHADKVEIYTDVDGVMTADPRIVKNAHIIKQISYDEIREMAHQGAKVIHPRAVEIVMR